ncbi:uncharacterized protein LOC121738224 [Aricia agestis]|uniref:uncharacterized protein LOC121738224 n=1 Tax=Aricia agestis TaxID=91739 RepID=UPI001C205FEF|nr:uncharacterized protein LOC121738224 [Aricia agestis]
MMANGHHFNVAIFILFTMWFFYTESTHVFTLEEDFSRINTDEKVRNYASDVLKKLNTFAIKVHPRIRLFYKFLMKKMLKYAHENSESLYNPYVYKENNKNIARYSLSG